MARVDVPTKTRDDSDRDLSRATKLHPALVLVWARAVPERVGEALVVERTGRPHVFGRGAAQDGDELPRLSLVRQRPGRNDPTPPLEDPFLSRAQLLIERQPDGLVVENRGKRPLVTADGEADGPVRVEPGDLLEVKGELCFLCCARPKALASLRTPRKELHAFGQADEQGLVGESPAAWALRDQIAFIAARSAHVLLLGESGTGKEIVAQAIHARSSRGGRRIVSRNAATLPAGIADAELFGNIANYPNAGTPERAGLIGEADGSTLFLDEIGELPEELQTRLLRVLDDGGEYQRLGDAKRRSSNLRLIGATNRPASALRNDVAARLRLRLTLPTLGERAEDVPLIAAHLLRRIAKHDPDAVAPFLRDGTPAMSCELVRALVQRRYAGGVREVEAVLWESIATSPDDCLELTDAARASVDEGERGPAVGRVHPQDLTEADVRAALDRVGGVQERAWRELGLANRYVLKRLVKKLGLKDVKE